VNTWCDFSGGEHDGRKARRAGEVEEADRRATIVRTTLGEPPPP